MKPPICAPCKRQMEVQKNGVWWVNMRSFSVKNNGNYPLGIDRIYHKAPYKATSCDRWRCPMCGQEVLTGFAPSSVEVDVDRFLSECLKMGEEIVYEEVYRG